MGRCEEARDLYINAGFDVKYRVLPDKSHDYYPKLIENRIWRFFEQHAKNTVWSKVVQCSIAFVLIFFILLARENAPGYPAEWQELSGS